jgi:type IV secretory pathway TraG/TraD family ATPase VirD4
VTTSTAAHIKERPLISAFKVRLMGQGRAIVLNSGYRSESGEEEYLPYKLKIQVFDEYKAMTQWSASQWPHAKNVFVSQSPQRPIDPQSLKAGVRRARELLRMPTQEELDQKAAHDVLAQY